MELEVIKKLASFISLGPTRLNQNSSVWVMSQANIYSSLKNHEFPMIHRIFGVAPCG
jgi:hypothetical protein